VFSAAGVATVSAVGSSLGGSDGVATSAGTATVSGVGASTAAAVFSASGVASVSGVGDQATSEAVATAAGQATVTGVGASIGGSTVDTHDGFDPYQRKRKARGGKRKKEVEDLLAKLMGLAPEDPPVEVEKALTVAKAAVQRLASPENSRDYTAQIEAIQTASLQLAKLEAALRQYEDEEEDDDLLLMSM
jgi:hypothetical protein